MAGEVPPNQPVPPGEGKAQELQNGDQGDGKAQTKRKNERDLNQDNYMYEDEEMMKASSVAGVLSLTAAR